MLVTKYVMTLTLNSHAVELRVVPEDKVEVRFFTINNEVVEVREF